MPPAYYAAAADDDDDDFFLPFFALHSEKRRMIEKRGYILSPRRRRRKREREKEREEGTLQKRGRHSGQGSVSERHLLRRPTLIYILQSHPKVIPPNIEEYFLFLET